MKEMTQYTTKKAHPVQSAEPSGAAGPASDRMRAPPEALLDVIHTDFLCCFFGVFVLPCF